MHAAQATFGSASVEAGVVQRASVAWDVGAFGQRAAVDLRTAGRIGRGFCGRVRHAIGCVRGTVGTRPAIARGWSERPDTAFALEAASARADRLQWTRIRPAEVTPCRRADISGGAVRARHCSAVPAGRGGIGLRAVDGESAIPAGRGVIGLRAADGEQCQTHKKRHEVHGAKASNPHATSVVDIRAMPQDEGAAWEHSGSACAAPCAEVARSMGVPRGARGFARSHVIGSGEPLVDTRHTRSHATNPSLRPVLPCTNTEQTPR